MAAGGARRGRTVHEDGTRSYQMTGEDPQSHQQAMLVRPPGRGFARGLRGLAGGEDGHAGPDDRGAPHPAHPHAQRGAGAGARLTQIERRPTRPRTVRVGSSSKPASRSARPAAFTASTTASETAIRAPWARVRCSSRLATFTVSPVVLSCAWRGPPSRAVTTGP